MWLITGRCGNVGMPVEDAAWGYEIYRNALSMGMGTKLKLWDSPAMA